MPVEADSLQSSITEIVELSWRRQHAISVVNRQVLATKALVRRLMGWRVDLPEKQRKEIATKASAIVDAGLSGKTSTADAHLAAMVGLEIDLLAASTAQAKEMRSTVEKRMTKLTRGLPGYAFAKQARGFGDLGFAIIVGMAGDLARYDDPKKLAKRLGLSPFTRDDGDTRAGSNWMRKGGLTNDEIIRAGYNPRRRGDMHGVISESLFRAQWQSAAKAGADVGRPTGRYGEAYARRRARTAITHPEWTPGQSHQDALRIMTQRLVLDLWMAWRCDLNGQPQPYLRHAAPALGAVPVLRSPDAESAAAL